MPSMPNTDLQTLTDFLRRPTPQAWLDAALKNIPLLLLDHAHCERKAAAAAIALINKYPACAELVSKMSRLAREELLHLEKVLAIMSERGIKFIPLKPSDYGQSIHGLISKKADYSRLRDQLITGAIIEARSCERFYALLPLLELKDKTLCRFYSSLVKSEARHFQDYLQLAKLYGEDVEERVEHFLRVENALIEKEDAVFRFHSGVPLLT